MRNIGVLWDEEVEWDRDRPFGDDGATNSSYSVYSDLARDRDMKLVVGKYNWYGDGKLRKGWVHNGEEWEKVKNVGIDGVYDKFKFDSSTRELKKRIADEVGVLNSFRLEKLCKDKYLTYREFPDHVPETKLGSRKNIEEMLDKYGKVVVKPRYDFGGHGIKVIESVEEADHLEEDSDDYIVQAFIDSSGGIPDLGISGMHDLRGVVINDTLAEAYVRQPNEGYLSNTHQGGSIRYVDRDKYPESAETILSEVREKFKEFKPNLYTVDLIFDEEGEPWILELNSKPGIGYFEPEEEKEYEYPTMKKVIETLNKL